jgi:hypothetical protein
MKRLLVLAVVVASAALPGCGSPDNRLSDMARQTTHEQAQQNQWIAEGSKAIAEGSKQLVEADANARRDAIELQQDLRQDQAEVGKQRDRLEADRKQIAGKRIQGSQAGALCVGFAILLVCLAPLVLAACSLLGLWHGPTPEEEGGILIEELTISLAEGSTRVCPALPESSARGMVPPDAVPPA